MIRPSASEGLSNAHYAAMGNYILMPQTGIPHAGLSQTQATGGANTAQAHLQAVQNSQVPVTSHQMNPQSAGATAAGYRQQFQYPLHSVGQQLIVPQMQQFQMQQFPLLQTAMMPTQMIATHPAATHLVQHPAYAQRTNKLRPKASENIKLPDPLPECISKLNQTTELYCNICELSVNSQQQLTQHLGSTKHKLVSLGLLPKPSEDPNVKKVGQYKCKTCDVILNSEAQLVQHLKSLRHQAAERGEELPPRGERRFCPYQVKSATGGQSNQLSGVRKAGDTPLDLNSTQNCSTSISETKTDTSVTPSSGTVDEEKCKNQEKLAKDQDQPTINSELNKQETTNNNTEKSATTTTTTTTQEATQLTTS